MPKEQDFKRLVRQRMAVTGERYTAARAALDRRVERSGSARRWVDLLAMPEHAQGAFRLLEALPGSELVALAVDGLRHPDWRVRRACCRLLDDLALTSESVVALEARLEDEHPAVRRNALHTLACDRCKPDGRCLDARSLFERLLDDPSASVRKMVVGSLEWKHNEPWAEALLERAARDDRSAQLRESARKGLARLERQRRSDEARRALRDDVRRKTERHPGKWVAIDGDTIIGVEAFQGGLRRIIKGKRATDAQIYWVDPRTCAPATPSRE